MQAFLKQRGRSLCDMSHTSRTGCSIPPSKTFLILVSGTRDPTYPTSASSAVKLGASFLKLSAGKETSKLSKESIWESQKILRDTAYGFLRSNASNDSVMQYSMNLVSSNAHL